MNVRRRFRCKVAEKTDGGSLEGTRVTVRGPVRQFAVRFGLGSADDLPNECLR